MRKLFLALCILGSGINVHAVEETSTKTINAQKLNTGDAEMIGTVVRPTSVEQVDNMFEKAAKSNQLSEVRRLLEEEHGFVPTSETVNSILIYAARHDNRDLVNILLDLESNRKLNKKDVATACSAAADEGHIELVKIFLNLQDQCRLDQIDVCRFFVSAGVRDRMNVLHYVLGLDDGRRLDHCSRVAALIVSSGMGKSKPVELLLNDRHITSDDMLSAFGVAEGDDVIDLLLNDHRITPDSLTPLLKKFLNNTGGLSLSVAVAQRLVSKDIFDAVMPMLKLRDPGTTKLSKLPSGVFRAMIEYAFSTNAFPHIK